MRAVNLLPPDARQSRFTVPPLAPTAGVAASVLAIAVIGGVAHVERGHVAAKQQELDSVKAQLAAVPQPSGAPAAEAVALLGTRSARLTALNTALTGSVAWDTVLRQFSLVLPDDVWLESLSLTSTPPSSDSSTTGAAPSAGTVSFEGYTYDNEGVAHLLSRLAVVPTLGDVTLVSADAAPIGKKNVVKFSITANLRGGGS